MLNISVCPELTACLETFTAYWYDDVKTVEILNGSETVSNNIPLLDFLAILNSRQ